MRQGPKNDPFARAWEEFNKCVFCGFCEASCPTLAETEERGYGPRGRVRVVGLLLNGIYSEKTAEYLYTCLLCYACVPPCPTGVNIPGIVEAGRAILVRHAMAMKRK
ncbi:MAG: (Fe-S)-binding protein [Desulfurococcales archaeon]|jgi:glycolate oxidase iron-sulfur subunit|nr:(Fe-S)-binding protein [Desulfurococcales archaeon]